MKQQPFGLSPNISHYLQVATCQEVMSNVAIWATRDGKTLLIYS